MRSAQRLASQDVVASRTRSASHLVHDSTLSELPLSWTDLLVAVLQHAAEKSGVNPKDIEDVQVCGLCASSSMS